MYSNYLSISLRGISQPLFFEVSPESADELRVVLECPEPKCGFWSVETKDGREIGFSISRVQRVQFVDEPLCERFPLLNKQLKCVVRVAVDNEPELLSWQMHKPKAVAKFIADLYESNGAGFVWLSDSDGRAALNFNSIIFVDAPSTDNFEATHV